MRLDRGQVRPSRVTARGPGAQQRCLKQVEELPAELVIAGAAAVAETGVQREIIRLAPEIDAGAAAGRRGMGEAAARASASGSRASRITQQAFIEFAIGFRFSALCGALHKAENQQFGTRLLSGSLWRADI